MNVHTLRDCFYRRYLLTTFATNNTEYNKQLKEALSQDKAAYSA